MKKKAKTEDLGPQEEIPAKANSESPATEGEESAPKKRKTTEVFDKIELTDEEKALANVEISKTDRGNKVSVFGVPITALLRWCGKNNISPNRAEAMLNDLGISVTSRATIECQVRGWTKRGKVPQFTQPQLDILNKFLPEGVPPVVAEIAEPAAEAAESAE